MSEQWLSIVEYARQHNVSDMTVRRRIKNGKLKSVLKDGKYFIPVQKEQPKAAESSQVKSIDLGLVKNHPSAHATVRSQESITNDYFKIAKGDDTNIPTEVDINQLVKTCQAGIDSFKKAEHILAQKYSAEITAVKARNESLAMENTQLKQQIEDLQLLVKMIGNKA